MSEALLSSAVLAAVSSKDQKLWSVHSNRLQIALLLCFGMACCGIMRGSLSFAMVCMVSPPDADANASASSPPAGLHDDYNREFQVDWSSSEQSIVHAGYYAGAFIAIVLTDYIVKKIDARTVLSLALVCNVIGAVSIPPAVVFVHFFPVAAFLRFVQGFGGGLIAPCGLLIISKWFPTTEKSTAVAVFTTGNQLGVALSMFLTAKMCQLSFAGGWPNSFILYGALTAIYVVVWQWRGSTRPRCSKYITAVELEYITGRRGVKSRAISVVIDTPYKKVRFTSAVRLVQIFLSPCIFAICVNSFAQSFVLTILISFLPRFNQEVFKMDVTANGIWSSAPFVLQMTSKILFGLWADAIKKRGASPTLVTWIFNGVATWGAACFIVLAPFESSAVVANLCICAAMLLFGAFVPGYNTAVVCVAPQFTATVSSYQQLYAQIASLLAPMLVGFMTTNRSLAEWRIVYCMLAFVLVVAGVAYQIWGHGRTEAWGADGSRLPSITVDGADGIDVRRESGGGRTTSRASLRLSETLEAHNALLAAQPAPPMKRMTRVSYRDCEPNIPETIEELENDVVEEEDEDADSPANPNGLTVAVRRRLLSRDPDPELVRPIEP